MKRFIVFVFSVLLLVVVACGSSAGSADMGGFCSASDFNHLEVGCIATNTFLTNPAYVYKWDWGDGSDQTEGRRPSHTYSKAGQYKVTIRRYLEGDLKEEVSFSVRVSQ